jgi:ketosteroid isomerase-like protein
MSQEDVETVRRYYEAADRTLEALWSQSNAGIADLLDGGEALTLVHPDVQWHSIIRKAPFHGNEGIIAAVQDWLDAVEDWRMRVEEQRDLGDGRVFSALVLSIRGKGSGVPVEQRLFSVVTVREGKITRLFDFPDRAAALEAAGLSE